MKLAFEQFLITIGLVAGVPVPEAVRVPLGTKHDVCKRNDTDV